MDLGTIGLVGVMAIGAVNIVSFFKPNMDSRIKVAISFVVALLTSLIPADIQSVVLEKISIAVAATLASSGGYKIAQKMGGQK